MTTIDLNSDMGELPALLADGTQDRIMDHVSSVNISCGAHAGDDATISATLCAAKQRSLAIGAHPGYPDRANFGRTTMDIKPSDLLTSLEEQLRRLAGLAKPASVELIHVKPHGALYHDFSKGGPITETFLLAIKRFNPHLIIVAFAGSRGLAAAKAMGFQTAAEAFIDRAYEPDGALRNRALPNALLPTDQARLQAVEIVQHGQAKTAAGVVLPLEAQTLCVHSDTPGSAIVAAHVASSLRAAGVQIAPLRRN
jgi:UPF0271 protein